MFKKCFKLMIAFLLPLAVNAQTSLFYDGEATTGAIRNLAHNTSTGTDAVIYNPAGLAFASGKFALSVNGTASYQTVLCTPYSLDGNGDPVYGWAQNATMRNLSPSVQGYAKVKNGTISFSYANEGGVKWFDPEGDPYMSRIFENLDQLEDAVSTLYDTLNGHDLLANDDDYMHWSTSNYLNQSYNHCLRFGESFDLGGGFSVYLGMKYNHFKVTSSSDNDLFVYMPSQERKMLFIDYFTEVVKAKALGNLTEDMEQNIQRLDSLLHSAIQVSYEYPSMDLHAFSPVVGLAFNYKTLNVGMKYELPMSAWCESGQLLFPHVFSAGVSNLFWNRLLVSASADLRWGYKDNEALSIQFEQKPLGYQFGLGFDYNVTDKLKIGLSTAGGNMTFFNSHIGRISENYCSQWDWKFSGGLQWKIGDRFMFDFGVMSTLWKHSAAYRFTINGVPQDCDYKYSNMVKVGMGITYGF